MLHTNLAIIPHVGADLRQLTTAQALHALCLAHDALPTLKPNATREYRK